MAVGPAALKPSIVASPCWENWALKQLSRMTCPSIPTRPSLAVTGSSWESLCLVGVDLAGSEACWAGLLVGAATAAAAVEDERCWLLQLQRLQESRCK